METGVAVRQSSGIAPMTVNDLAQVGKVFEQSGMFGCKQQGQGLVLAMTCQMSGMNPLEFIETYHIVEGRPTMRADAMLAGLLTLGGKYEVLSRDANRAGIKATFRDATITVTLSWDEAKQEPFVYKSDGKTVKHNWATPRGRMQMLWARVASDAVRTVCPLANKGCYTPEEIQDLRDNVPAAPASGKATDPKTITIPTDEGQPATSHQATPEVKPQQTQAPAEVVDHAEVLPPVTIDYSVMPIGKQAGKPWSELSDSALAKVTMLPREQYVEITDKHIEAVKAEIERRKVAQQ